MNYPQYNPQTAVLPLTEAELHGLDSLLQSLPAEAVMSLDGVDGFFTAMLVGPPQWLAKAPTADWLPWVWGGDGPLGMDEAAPFASKRQRKDTVVLLLRHLRHLHQQLLAAPEDWEPIFSVAEQGPDEWVDARDWCAGFLQAVDLSPRDWEATWDDPAMGPALAPLLLLGGGLEANELAHDEAEGLDADTMAEDLNDPSVCDSLSRAVPDAVLRLLAQREARPLSA